MACIQKHFVAIKIEFFYLFSKVSFQYYFATFWIYHWYIGIYEFVKESVPVCIWTLIPKFIRVDTWVAIPYFFKHRSFWKLVCRHTFFAFNVALVVCVCKRIPCSFAEGEWYFFGAITPGEHYFPIWLAEFCQVQIWGDCQFVAWFWGNGKFFWWERDWPRFYGRHLDIFIAIVFYFDVLWCIFIGFQKPKSHCEFINTDFALRNKR